MPLPYAIGARTTYPDRQVVVFTGDGSLTMQLGDFLTAVRHRLPIKVVVVRNDTLGLISWEQMVFLGNPEYGVNMAPPDFVRFAEACGAMGIRRARSGFAGSQVAPAEEEPGSRASVVGVAGAGGRSGGGRGRGTGGGRGRS